MQILAYLHAVPSVDGFYYGVFTVETNFTLPELDQLVYNKLLFFLDRNKYKVTHNKVSDHTIEYLIYLGSSLAGVFKITQRQDGIVEYTGNSAGIDNPEVYTAWSNLYY